MKCNVCGAEYSEGDKICQFCGCDLPRVAPKVTTNTSQVESSTTTTEMSSVDFARQQLLAREKNDEKVFFILKICLALALLSFFLPFFTYKYQGVSEEVADTLNALAGKEVFEVSEISDLEMSGLDLVLSKDFDTDIGTLTIGRNFSIIISALCIVAALLFCFISIDNGIRIKVIASCSLLSLITMISASLSTADALFREGFGIGFVLFFIFALASAALSAFLKAMS